MTDLDRILGLPTRSTRPWHPEAVGGFRLRPIQAEALGELAASPHPRGAIFGLQVGAGKTIVGMLAPTAAKASRPLLIVPAHLKAQTLSDHARWSKVFPCTPPQVVTYAKLSRNPNLLRKLNPDLIVCDEAHYLGNFDSARTQRVIRHAQDFPDTRWVFMSGSLVGASVMSYWHLALIALREGSPLPANIHAAEKWAAVTDHDADPSKDALRYLRPLGASPRAIRKAAGARLVSAPGVVWQREGYDEVPLEMAPVTHQLTPRCSAALRILDRDWELPDGTMLVDATDIARHAMTLPWGFWLAWDWDAIGGYDEEWNEARLDWARVVRQVRSWGDRELDSLSTIVAAVEAGNLDSAEPAYRAWLAVKDRPRPPSVPVFFDRSAARPILDEVRRMGRGIVWYRSPGLGELLRVEGIPTYGRGDGFPDDAPIVALSSRVYGTGTDGLQLRWARNLVLQPPADWEQLVGRTHRPGQTEIVRVGVVVTTKHQAKSLHFSKVKAEVSADLSSSSKKILSARWRDQVRWY